MRWKVRAVLAASLLMSVLVVTPALAFDGIARMKTEGCGISGCHVFETWRDGHGCDPDRTEGCETCHPNNHTTPGAPSAPESTYEYAIACSCHAGRPLAVAHSTLTGSTQTCESCHYASGTLSGYVRDSRGVGLEGVNVAVGSVVSSRTYGGQYIISKIPTGTYNVTYAKTGYVSKTLTVTIVDSTTPLIQDVVLATLPGTGTPPDIVTVGLVSATRDAAYHEALLASGDAPITWSLNPGSTLPAGLGLSADGALSGTPTVAGTFSFTVKATNASGSDTQELTLVVAGPAPTETLIPVYRFYNARVGTHFYTPSAEERDMVMVRWPHIFAYEGVAYTVNPANNSQPLYRFYNNKSGSHFYTASTEERDMVIVRWPHVFTYEGETYRVSPADAAGKTPVYRFYNLNNGSHFYTASAEERDTVMARWSAIYSYEGPVFYLGQ